MKASLSSSLRPIHRSTSGVIRPTTIRSPAPH